MKVVVGSWLRHKISDSELLRRLTQKLYASAILQGQNWAVSRPELCTVYLKGSQATATAIPGVSDVDWAFVLKDGVSGESLLKLIENFEHIRSRRLFSKKLWGECEFFPEKLFLAALRKRNGGRPSYLNAFSYRNIYPLGSQSFPETLAMGAEFPFPRFDFALFQILFFTNRYFMKRNSRVPIVMSRFVQKISRILSLSSTTDPTRPIFKLSDLYKELETLMGVSEWGHENLGSARLDWFPFGVSSPKHFFRIESVPMHSVEEQIESNPCDLNQKGPKIDEIDLGTSILTPSLAYLAHSQWSRPELFSPDLLDFGIQSYLFQWRGYLANRFDAELISFPTLINLYGAYFSLLRLGRIGGLGWSNEEDLFETVDFRSIPPQSIRMTLLKLIEKLEAIECAYLA